jgi:hypothetical protein
MSNGVIFKMQDLRPEHQQQVRKQLGLASGGCPTVQDADDKRPERDATLPATPNYKVGCRCSIVVHHRRRRLADVGNLQAKAAIDGLRYAKILRDDRPEFVASETHVQEKINSKDEETTTIRIYRDI